MDLAKSAGYNHDLDSTEIFLDMFRVKFGVGDGMGVAEYRNQVYTSGFSGQTSCPPKVLFMDEVEVDEDKIIKQYL